ncbi:hypothetical protein [Halorubrum sp. AJ67]|uniref:hypothetical protein n=1 Tax=Halorubrum sp. AJ67 TaxID=1173487 RepID=UPI0003DBF632|nr:hypothetical protein [Halorubrum sp. AJ67]CDK38154.1 hypothetical protein BN903_354 [Halorubrum sp. AJ67]
MPDTHDADHEFKGTWRWPAPFEAWVESLIADVDGPIANICAGLSPLGTIRIDMKTPVEIIENLQAESSTTLQDAREYLADLIVGNPPIDVVGSLYTADNPSEHPAAEYILTNNTVRADVLSDTLPFDDDTFAFVICDPPWLKLNTARRARLFDELIRITEPGGRILFNAYWTPTADGPVTLDRLVPRQDTDRWSVGTPNVSWASLYTVHDSVHTARHLSATLTQREFTPSPSALEESTRAHRHYELTQIHGHDPDSFDLDIVDPATTDQCCPQCGHTDLYPVSQSEVNTSSEARLYECANCQFRSFPEETDQSPAQATISSAAPKRSVA